MIKYSQVNTFSRSAFSGNPAAVVFMQSPMLRPEQMARVACEVNQPMVVFLEDQSTSSVVRVWFHNGQEMVGFSGHGMQAAAHAIWTEGRAPFGQALCFQARDEQVNVNKRADHLCMRLAPWSLSEVSRVEGALTSIPEKCFTAERQDMLVVQQESEAALVAWQPDPRRDWTEISGRMLVLTAPSANSQRDFVSRSFRIDPNLREVGVSGSAHRALLPFWMDKLSREDVRGEQLSPRRGVVHGLRLSSGELEISGQAITTLKAILIVHP